MELRPKLDGLDIEQLHVLDLGCGHNDTPVSGQVLTLPFRWLTSVDIYKPYIDLLCEKTAAALHHEIIDSDIRDYVCTARADSYDVTLMLDVLEHSGARQGSRCTAP